MAGGMQQETVEELEARFRAAKDVVERSHCQVMWLLAKGHSTADVAEIVALSPRWVNALARRYEAEGVEALGDRRRRNARSETAPVGRRPGGAARATEDPAGRRRAVERAEGRALDRGAAGAGARTCAARLGGAEEDRLVDPGAAAAEPEGGGARGAGGVQKKLGEVVAEEREKTVLPVELWATDEHRLGLKPVRRRVWAPVGERPRSRSATTASSGSTSPPSSRRRAARRSGTSPTASTSRSSR